jgi:hypothetical protein
MDSAEWDWEWAVKQFSVNRQELGMQSDRHVGFGHINHRAAAVGFGRRDANRF